MCEMALRGTAAPKRGIDAGGCRLYRLTAEEVKTVEESGT
jgi:hypothetical protein